MFSSRTLRAFVLLIALCFPPASAFNPSPPGRSPFENKAASVDTNEDWNSLTEMIQSKIGAAEDKMGKPLSEEAKDEIVATAIAGSVLGTALGSPLLIGAALGYAGTQMLSEEQRAQAQKVFGKASKNAIEQANAALEFTKKQLEEEKDLSAASKKILLKIQEEANKLQEDIKKSPQNFMENWKSTVMETVESEEFKQLPKNTFNAVRTFIESEEVKKASNSAMKAMRAGMESEEMKNLKQRAAHMLKDTLGSENNA